MVHYALRLTPYPQENKKDEYVRNHISDFLQSIGALGWLYGRETTKNIHYHIVFEIDTELKSKDITDKLYEDFQVPEGKRGNSSFSMTEVRDIPKALSYAVKDGDYSFSENWEEDAHNAYQNSSKKKQSSKSLMEDLQSRFNKDEINERSLWIELCKGRAYLNIPHRSNTITEIVETMKINKNPEYAIELWEKEELKKIPKT